VIICLAVVCFTAQFAFTKVYESSVKQTMTTSLVMLVVTSLIGTILYLFIGGFQVRFTWFSFFWAIGFALVMIPYYMVGIKVLSLGSLTIYSMFMMLGGMIVPFLYGIIWLQEDVSWGKIVGSLLLTICIIFQAVWQNQSTGEVKKASKKSGSLFFILCLIVFFLNGMTGVIAKAHQIGKDPVDEISFTVISCALTAMISGILLLCSGIRGDKTGKIEEIKTVSKRKSFLAMSAIGAATYTGNFLHLKAASNVPASVQFPLVSGGVIVLSAMVSAFIFKEKISKKEWVSVLGAFVSTFLFMF